MSTAFRIVMQASQEVPPTSSTASGLGTFVFDSAAVTASYSIRIKGIDFGLASGGAAQTPTLLDDATGSHFHNNVRGQNGPVVFGQIHPEQDNDDLSIVLNKDSSWTVSGLWETRTSTIRWPGMRWRIGWTAWAETTYSAALPATTFSSAAPATTR